MIKYCLLVLFALAPPFPGRQDEGVKIKDIVLPLSVFYLGISPVDALENCPINQPPENSHWHFYFQQVDRSGKPNGKPTQVDLRVFYSKILGIVSYGTKDAPSIADPEVNANYITFIRTLMDCGIFDKRTIEWMADRYRSSRWAESCYFLEEAAGNLFTDEQWQDMRDHPYNGGSMTPYFEVLAKIRLARGDPEKMKDVGDYLDKSLYGELPEYSTHFKDFGCYLKAYSELQRKGVLFAPERVGSTLFDLYFDFDAKLATDFSELYQAWGLAAPHPSEVEASLIRLVKKELVRVPLVRHLRARGLVFPAERLSNYLVVMVNTMETCDPEDFRYLVEAASDDIRRLAAELSVRRLKEATEPIPAVVHKFRLLRLDFPVELAAKYRDLILEEFGKYDFADVEYLLRYSGNANLPPEALKSYGDESLDWHFNKENANRKSDGFDHYHAAVECYRRLQPLVDALTEQAGTLARKANRTEKEEAEYKALAKRVQNLSLGPNRKIRLLEAAGDLNVRMRDVIFSYLISGRDPKTDELAMQKLDQRVERFRALRSGAYFDANSVIFWRRDDSGRPLIPFREEIELAAHLKDNVMTRGMAVKIADALVEQIQDDGRQIIADFERRRCVTPEDFQQYRQALESSETPTYLNLRAIVDLMVYLDFQDGLRSLAQCLHDAAFDFQARKVFRLAGIGKEADAKYYGKHDEAYWIARERRFNYEMRVYGLFDNQK